MLAVEPRKHEPPSSSLAYLGSVADGRGLVGWLAVCGEAARDVLNELVVAADALGIGTAVTDALTAEDGLHAYLLDGGPLGSAGILARRKDADFIGLGRGVHTAHVGRSPSCATATEARAREKRVAVTFILACLDRVGYLGELRQTIVIQI